MQYRLRSLLILTTIAPPVLAVGWFFTHSVVEMLGWFGFAGFFGLTYWSLTKSQAIAREAPEPETREPGGFRSDNWPF
jgi:hypothetical protein